MGFFRKLVGRPDQDDFAEIVTDLLTEHGETRSIHYNSADFSLRLGEGNQAIHFWLRNAFQDYLLAPRSIRKKILHHYMQARKHPEIPREYEKALPSLLPSVRTASYLSITALLCDSLGMNLPPAPSQAITDHLRVNLIYDLPESMSAVSDRDLSSWNRSFEEVLEAARDNLWKISNRKFQRIEEHTYKSTWNDNHDASRLFLHDLLWHLDVNGDHVAAIPNRDTLLVTGSEDLEGLQKLAELCEKLIEEPRFISAVPVTLQQKHWTKLQLDKNHPLAPRFKRLAVLEEARDYAEQKTLLEKKLRVSGKDLFVATYSVVQKEPSGEYQSYCVWSSGVPALLPKTEEVMFWKDQIVARVKWDTAYQLLENLMTPVEIQPIRYHVEGFPTAQELADLKY
ncbi:MAG: hypothetical protein C5B54_11585 [Acidobacteria bacterium]|nr:MAG: hypothetical protein C5B54_11585 [Acidobacteriota bacterium]